MQKRLSAGSQLEERQLFHGTRNDYLEAICQQGFDWRVCGTSTGCMYGKGSYFAKKARYSADYTNCRTLFVVRVLVGEFTRGMPKYVKPPAKAGQSLALYDSCVDNTKDPNIFVIFEQQQAYPEYIITY